MANVFEPEFDSDEQGTGFKHRRARLGRQAGSQRLGASLYEVPPGQATFPYHAHFANEEMLIVLGGQPTLRTPAGERELDEGEVVAFPVGPEGAHQLINRSDAPVRFVVISEMVAPEVNLYPDSDKVVAATRPPGGKSRDDDVFGAFRLGDAVDYWDEEEPPETGG